LPSRPTDPNELLGPGGYGAQNFVAAGSLLPYRINFENATNATAPAQFVTVQNVLATNLDLASFELSSLGFGDRFFAIPPGSQHYERTETLTMDGFRFQVQIEAGLNLATRTVYATFRSLNPTNGLPPPVEIGFLPPENGTGRGQGHLSYIVKPKPGLTTGTEIRNIASIVFDQQPAIGTDWVDPHDGSKGIDTNKQALVTIDADGPMSMVTNPNGTAGSAKFQVCWFGADIGSGIAGYDVYVSTNGTTWTLWLANTTTNCATFLGANNVTYRFYSVARDNTGQTEPVPTTPDVIVTTPPNSPPELNSVPNYVMSVNQTLTITNVASDPDFPAQMLTFSLVSRPGGSIIGEQTGVFRWTPRCDQGNSTNRVSIRVTDNGLPVHLSATQTFLVTVRECVEASLGNTVMLAGSSNAVSIRLLSTVELTNLAFTVGYPASRFTNFSLTVDTQQVSSPLLLQSNGQAYIALTLPSTSVLHGPTNVGDLGFTAVAGQSSAFVPLLIQDIDGLRPNGQPVANAYGQPGRVVVVGPEPLLEAFLLPNRDVQLVLYGPPAATVRVEWAPQLPAGSGSWTVLTQTNLTSLTTLLPSVSANASMRFFRAVRP
jgi:hypothetical protein